MTEGQMAIRRGTPSAGLVIVRTMSESCGRRLTLTGRVRIATHGQPGMGCRSPQSRQRTISLLRNTAGARPQRAACSATIDGPAHRRVVSHSIRSGPSRRSHWRGTRSSRAKKSANHSGPAGAATENMPRRSSTWASSCAKVNAAEAPSGWLRLMKILSAPSVKPSNSRPRRRRSRRTSRRRAVGSISNGLNTVGRSCLTTSSTSQARIGGRGWLAKPSRPLVEQAGLMVLVFGRLRSLRLGAGPRHRTHLLDGCL